MKQVKDEPEPLSSDQTLDLITIVEELNGFASKEIVKLLKDSEDSTIQYDTGRGPQRQVDVERLAASLPLHLVAVLLSSEPERILAHLLRGVRLLHTLSDVASHHTRLEQILLDDVKVSEQLIDLAFFMLIVLAQTEQDCGPGTSVPPLHSALVACTFHLLAGYISSQWHELVHVLLAHPKVDIFMDVAFDAVHADIRFLHVKLSALENDISCKSPSLPAAERTTNFLCQQCEVSLQFLLSLCQQKLFRDRLLKNKELCQTGGILSLCHTILKLTVPDSYVGSVGMTSAVSRLKSKALSILLQLCEAESVSYLDEVAGSSKSMRLAKSVALEILALLKTRKEVQQIRNSLDRGSPKGLVLLNSLHLADIFSDDSNFRSFFMTNAVLLDILATPHEEFQSSWCSADIPMVEEDVNLEYDPFTAAGIALILSRPDCESGCENNFGCHSNFSGAMPSATCAQQKSSFLVKIIANLHCFVPNICEEEERNLFLNKLRESLHSESAECIGYPSNFKAKKAALICENLSSLSDHAVSMIPNLLNDEDVSLLRVFTDQLKKLIPPQTGGSLIQKPYVKVKDAEGTTHKVEDMRPMHQPLPNWTNYPNTNHNKIEQDTQNTWRGEQSTLGSMDASSQSEIPNLKVELDQHILTTKPADPPDDIEFDQKLKCIIVATSTVSEQLINVEKECQIFETKDIDMILDRGELSKAAEHAKESGLQDDEKVDGAQCEEKQPRKRKRNIMNEKQINMIENALVDEPEMQRNQALLQAWSDTLSALGSEITASQLKNWLNNRKARLARAARESRAPSEGGETSYPDKTSGFGPTASHFYESPDSANEEPLIPPSRTSSLNPIPNPNPNPKPGQLVTVVDRDGKEVGRGKVFQVEGRWQGKNLEDVGVCIVDVAELKVEKSKEVMYPSDGGGRTFEEAVARNGGVARVAWDVARVLPFPQ